MRHLLLKMMAITLLGTLFAVQPAVAQIAPGVTQSAAHTANIAGEVTASNGRPVAGANIKLTGTAVRSTKSAADGSFSFQSVPWGVYQVTVTSPLGVASRENIVLNGDVNVAIQYQAPTQLRTIAHVSTSNAGAHINVTSSSIASVSPSDYTFEGNSTWKNLFAQTPGVAVSGFTAGGFAAYGGVQGPQNPAMLVVNGALPYETSTSLDGMPLHNTSQALEFGGAGGGVDLSNLPLNAFSTADVVRGPGPDSPSIVDSIGGSFVLHAPGPVNANHFDFSMSNDPYGGIVTNARAAFHLNRLSATLIYGVNDSPGPLGTGTTMSAYSYPATTINGQTVWGQWSTYGIPNPSGIPNCDCAITNTMLYCCTPVSTAWSAHSGAADLSYKITPRVTAEVFYAGDTSVQEQTEARWPVAFSPEMASPPYSGTLEPSPASQTSYLLTVTGQLDPQNVSSSLLEGKVTAYAESGVFRVAALQYNSWSGDNYNLSLPNGTYKLWGTADLGPTSPGTPTAFNGVNANLTFSPVTAVFPSASSNRDLLASYDRQIGVSSSAGISYVKSYFNAPYSLTLYLGGTPIPLALPDSSIAATTNEARLHFDTQIGQKLSIALSEYMASATYHVPSSPGPYKDLNFPYSAPRLGVVWRPDSDHAIRFSVGGGYALPQLYEVTGSPLSCAAGYCTEGTPNAALKPEEAFGFDVGADLRIRRDSVLSVDLYRTNLFGQFFTTQSESSFMGQTLFQTTFGNIGTSRMEGINLDVRHDVPSGIYWNATLGLTRGYVVSVPAGFYNGSSGFPPTPCAKCANQTVIPGPNFNSATFLGTVPYAGASGQLGYRWNPRTFFDLTGTYYGNNNIYYYPAFVEFDAHAGYRITNALSLFATFQNITGIHDQPLAIQTPTYAVPAIQGATGFYQGATFGLPYAPRAVTAGLRVSI